MADHRVPSQPANHILANTHPHPALRQIQGHVQRVAFLTLLLIITVYLCIVLQNPPVAGGDDQQNIHQEGVPHPIRNAIMQGEMQYPPHIDAPNYNAAYHHPPPPPYPEVPYVHMHWNVGVAEAAPGQAHPFAPEVQENYDGLFVNDAQFPAADPPHIDAPNYNAAYHHPPPQPYPEVPYVHMHWNVGVAEAAPGQAHPFAPEVQENYDGLFVNDAQFPAADPPEVFPGVRPHPAAPANMPPANGLRNLANHYINNPGALVNMLRIEPGPGGRFEVWIALELPDVF